MKIVSCSEINWQEGRAITLSESLLLMSFVIGTSATFGTELLHFMYTWSLLCERCARSFEMSHAATAMITKHELYFQQETGPYAHYRAVGMRCSESALNSKVSLGVITLRLDSTTIKLQTKRVWTPRQSQKCIDRVQVPY